MRSELLTQLRCISCDASEWSMSANRESDVECVEGSVVCRTCSREYAIADGILDCVGSASSEEDETEGWIEFATKEGWCVHNPAYLDVLPFGRAKTLVAGDTLTWDRHCRNFLRVLSYLDLSDKRVLDLGAGRCWSTKYLALQTARCVALDTMADDHVGLRAASHYLSSLPIFFERVRGDMNELPFIDGTFEVVFAQGAIHHTTDMRRTLSECHRVLSGDGLLVFTNESCGGLRDVEAIEVEDMPGIHEHNYRAYRQYLWLRQAGFRKITVIPDVYWFRKDDSCHRRLSELARIHPAFVKLKLLLRGGVFNMIASKQC